MACLGLDLGNSERYMTGRARERERGGGGGGARLGRPNSTNYSMIRVYQSMKCWRIKPEAGVQLPTLPYMTFLGNSSNIRLHLPSRKYLAPSTIERQYHEGTLLGVGGGSQGMGGGFPNIMCLKGRSRERWCQDQARSYRKLTSIKTYRKPLKRSFHFTAPGGCRT